MSESEVETVVEPARACGIVMPISATPTHSAEHWAAVKELIERAARDAGFNPKAVWVAGDTDAITVRIVSQIVSAPMIVCDITDHNPNVMFELGLRLSAKFPTIIIREEGTKMPFDIADFEAIDYPLHLKFLQTETFIKKLAVSMKDKMTAFDNKTYRAFYENLEGVPVVDPISVKEVPFNEFVAEKLVEISDRLDGMEARSRSLDAARFETQSAGIPWPKSQNSFASDLRWSILVPRADEEFAHALLNDQFGEAAVSKRKARGQLSSFVVKAPAGPTITNYLRSHGIEAEISKMIMPS